VINLAIGRNRIHDILPWQNNLKLDVFWHKLRNFLLYTLVFHLFYAPYIQRKLRPHCKIRVFRRGRWRWAFCLEWGDPPPTRGRRGLPLPNRRPKLSLFYCYLLYSTSRRKNRSCEYVFLDKSVVSFSTLQKYLVIKFVNDITR